MQQRYYDPQIGRFLSVDPVTADANTGDNFNRFAYVGNNPYSFTDPDGRFRKLFAPIRKWIVNKIAPAPRKSPETSPGSTPRQSPDTQPQQKQQSQPQQQRQQQTREELRASDKQLGKKFGEHRNPDRPGYRNPKEYRERADELLNSSSAERVRFPADAPEYPGETHIREGGDLLRLDPRGQFRSMYPDP